MHVVKGVASEERRAIPYRGVLYQSRERVSVDVVAYPDVHN